MQAAVIAPQQQYMEKVGTAATAAEAAVVAAVLLFGHAKTQAVLLVLLAPAAQLVQAALAARAQPAASSFTTASPLPTDVSEIDTNKKEGS